MTLTGPPAASPRKDRFTRLMLVWIVGLATVWVGDRVLHSSLEALDEPRAIAPRAELGGEEKNAIALFEAASPAVVYIFAEDRGRPGTVGERDGNAGSGIVWDKSGDVVTNFHLVAGAGHIRVRLDSGESIQAKLIGAAPDQDLAVVRLAETREQLHPIAVGQSNDLKVGQTVYAIGNPFGLSRTLTRGIISALDRRLATSSNREIAGVIQTDAAINPGNSGGPLLDSAGRLIGVTTAIQSETGAFNGVGFAVPVDVVNRTVPALIRDGRVPRPGIGIVAAPEEIAARLGAAGLVIAEVEPRSSAAQAGLVAYDPEGGTSGDVITHVDGRAVHSVAEFAAELDRVGIGRKTTLSVLRSGRARSVDVTVMDIQRAS
jgi:2-alkenal reductase